jgi:hypothetical protein
MSLTQTEHVYAGLEEGALNDVLTAIFSTRPHYLNYGSPPFVSVSTASETRMDPIAFPGVAGGIPWSVSFDLPRIDLFPQTASLPPPLVLRPGQFSLQTKVVLGLLCGTKGRSRESVKDQRRPMPGSQTLHAALGVAALGHLDVRSFGGGAGDLGFAIDAVELVDLTPDSLETLLECLIRTLLDAALSSVRVPLEVLRARAFSLVLQRGPLIEGDRIKAYGTT